MASIFSLLFNDTVDGNGALANAVDLHRKQEVENGSILFGARYGVDEENSAKGKEKKRENERQRQTALQALLADPEYRAAYEALGQTIDESRDTLNDWNTRIEERLEKIDRKLSEDTHLSAIERERLEQERLEILRRQQDLFDLHTRIDHTEDKMQRGEFEDKEALDRARDEIEREVDALDQDFQTHFAVSRPAPPEPVTGDAEPTDAYAAISPSSLK